jgi:hypothetical protein
MRIICRSVVLSLSLMAAWFCHAADERHVVLITIDGFPARMFWDAKTPIPRIRQLAAEGAVAEGLRISNPTVTWPNHTTLVTGVRAASHSVLYNGILLREGPGLPVKVDPKRDRVELVAVPTLYDRLHEAGLRTAAINWPCTRNSTSLDDDFPDPFSNIAHFQTTLSENKWSLKTTLRENETTLFENRPTTLSRVGLRCRECDFRLRRRRRPTRGLDEAYP